MPEPMTREEFKIYVGNIFLSADQMRALLRAERQKALADAYAI